MTADSTHAPSYYAATANPAPAPEPLRGEHEADIGIVGGGFTGIATALTLAERGYSVAVVEANRVGWGASGRNGGQFTDSIDGDTAILRQLGREGEDFLWHLRTRGHEIIEERVQRYGIECDLRHGHLRAAKKKRQVAGLRADYEEKVRRGLGDVVEFVEGDDLRAVIGTDAYVAGIVNRRNGHLHPLNLCQGEADAARGLGAKIFEESPVTHIEHGDRPAIVTAEGRVRARTVIIGGNAYHNLEPGTLKGLIFPATSHIIVTEPLSEDLARAINPRNLAVYDSNYIIDYYRLTADRRLLFGAGCNYTGHDPADIPGVMRPYMEALFPQLEPVKIDYAWSGKIGVVLNRVPQLGRISDNVWYAQGYSGHGICLTHIVGETLADALEGRTQHFDLFNRVRHLRLPVGPWLGSRAVAAGMLWYRMLDKF